MTFALSSEVFDNIFCSLVRLVQSFRVIAVFVSGRQVAMGGCFVKNSPMLMVVRGNGWVDRILRSGCEFC
jgi:hypothetical protein